MPARRAVLMGCVGGSGSADDESECMTIVLDEANRTSVARDYVSSWSCYV